MTRARMMKKIQATDFAMLETALFLDAYPKNAKALEHYHKLHGERNANMSAYQEKYGPLNMYQNDSKDSWQWTDGPWPWEVSANVEL